MERGEQAGVSAVTKFPYQMWAAGEVHVDPLKGVRPEAELDTFTQEDKIHFQSSKNKLFPCYLFLGCFSTCEQQLCFWSRRHD